MCLKAKVIVFLGTYKRFLCFCHKMTKTDRTFAAEKNQSSNKKAMSVSLCTIGHHHLDTESVEKVASQLSDIFDINILWGYWEGNDFVEQGRITKHDDRPYHELHERSGRDFPVLYQLDVSWDDEEEPELQFFYMSIYKEIVDISFIGWPYRESDYDRCFWEDEPEMDEQTAVLLRSFRLRCKDVFGKLGCSTIYCFGGGYSSTGFLEETRLGMAWDEFEEYIISGRYLDDTEEQEVYHWKENSMIIYVSDFLSGKNPTRCKGSADIFIDDFADL